MKIKAILEEGEYIVLLLDKNGNLVSQLCDCKNRQKRCCVMMPKRKIESWTLYEIMEVLGFDVKNINDKYIIGFQNDIEKNNNQEYDVVISMNGEDVEFALYDNTANALLFPGSTLETIYDRYHTYVLNDCNDNL